MTKLTEKEMYIIKNLVLKEVIKVNNKLQKIRRERVLPWSDDDYLELKAREEELNTILNKLN